MVVTVSPVRMGEFMKIVRTERVKGECGSCVKAHQQIRGLCELLLYICHLSKCPSCTHSRFVSFSSFFLSFSKVPLDCVATRSMRNHDMSSLHGPLQSSSNRKKTSYRVIVTKQYADVSLFKHFCNPIRPVCGTLAGDNRPLCLVVMIVMLWFPPLSRRAE